MTRRFLKFSLAQANILIVDDADFARQLIKYALEGSGFRKIELAKNGEEALKMTRAMCPDLVILDLHMPVLDGFDYCEQVRADASLPRMPIIVQTGNEDPQVKLRALSCGADDFLKKPLDKDELDLRARLHLERFFMQQEAERMNDYLRMELAEMRELAHRLESNVPQDDARRLRRHFEVIETMAVLPAKQA